MFEALIYKPTTALEKQALSWIENHPKHDASPPLTALLLNRYSQLSDFAKKLIKKHRLDLNLAYLIKKLLERASLRREFFKQIEARMESEPDNYVWVIVVNSKKTSKEEEALTLKLIELNMDSEDNLIPLLVLSARYPSVIEHSLNWFNQQVYLDDNISMGLYGMQSQATDHFPEFLPKINRCVKKLLKGNAGTGAKIKDEHLAANFSTLIRSGGSKADIKKAREWYGQIEARKKLLYWDVLVAMLQCCSPRSKDGIWAVTEAKALLRDNLNSRRVLVLVEELLKACPDNESLAFAKEYSARGSFPSMKKLIAKYERAALKT